MVLLVYNYQACEQAFQRNPDTWDHGTIFMIFFYWDVKNLHVRIVYALKNLEIRKILKTLMPELYISEAIKTSDSHLPMPFSNGSLATRGELRTVCGTRSAPDVFFDTSREGRSFMLRSGVVSDNWELHSSFKHDSVTCLLKSIVKIIFMI